MDEDFAFIAPPPPSADAVEQAAQLIATLQGFKGTRAIGPGCMHCLSTIEHAPREYGIFIPRTKRMREASDDRVVIYNICSRCTRPSAERIRENVKLALMKFRFELATSRGKASA